MTQPARAPRADARRNRDAMLVAARAVFAERGLDAPLELIARAAGVSRATQHRHFPTRESLIRAIFDDNLEALTRIGDAVADPADAYLEIFHAAVEMLIREQGFIDWFNQRSIDVDIRRDIADRFLAVVSEPLRCAQQVGRLREDLRPDDTLLLLDMLGVAALPPGPGRPPDRIRRALALIMEAIDPEGIRRPLG